MHVLRNVILAVVSGLFVSCATLTPPQTKCGNPCAAVSCPSAFRCDVDASCSARCQPEAAPRH